MVKSWRADAHPRDLHGRFIEIGSHVRLWGGDTGVVKRNVGNGMIEVERDSDHSRVLVRHERITVLARPDGAKPIEHATDKPHAAPVVAASPHAVHEDVHVDAPTSVTTHGSAGDATFTVRHEEGWKPDTLPDTLTSSRVVAVLPDGTEAGFLSWNPDDHQVAAAWVQAESQRRGIASELWRQARAIDPELRHSDARTDHGNAWIAAVDGVAPDAKPVYAGGVPEVSDHGTQEAPVSDDPYAHLTDTQVRALRALNRVSDPYKGTNASAVDVAEAAGLGRGAAGSMAQTLNALAEADVIATGRSLNATQGQGAYRTTYRVTRPLSRRINEGTGRFAAPEADAPTAMPDPEAPSVMPDPEAALGYGAPDLTVGNVSKAVRALGYTRQTETRGGRTRIPGYREDTVTPGDFRILTGRDVVEIHGTSDKFDPATVAQALRDAGFAVNIRGNIVDARGYGPHESYPWGTLLPTVAGVDQDHRVEGFDEGPTAMPDPAAMPVGDPAVPEAPDLTRPPVTGVVLAPDPAEVKTWSPKQVDVNAEAAAYAEQVAEADVNRAIAALRDRTPGGKDRVGDPPPRFSSRVDTRPYRMTLAEVIAAYQPRDVQDWSSSDLRATKREDHAAELQAARDRLATAQAASKVYSDEYASRPWTRAFLVTSSTGGHVHKSMNCPTCNQARMLNDGSWSKPTSFIWLPEYAGEPEARIVGDAGERACTVCYPTAPAAVLNAPTRIFSPDERQAALDRATREQAKAERVAKANANAPTADGSPLVIVERGLRETFRTERAALNWYSAAADDHYGNWAANRPRPAHMTNLTDEQYAQQQRDAAAAMWANMETVVGAIAEKRGVDPSEVRLELATKHRAKARKGNFPSVFGTKDDPKVVDDQGNIITPLPWAPPAEDGPSAMPDGPAARYALLRRTGEIRSTDKAEVATLRRLAAADGLAAVTATSNDYAGRSSTIVNLVDPADRTTIVRPDAEVATPAAPAVAEPNAHGLVPVQVAAADMRAGDRLDPRGRSRVHTVHPLPSGDIGVGYRTTGTRSGGISTHAPDATVTVWRKPDAAASLPGVESAWSAMDLAASASTTAERATYLAMVHAALLGVDVPADVAAELQAAEDALPPIG